MLERLVSGAIAVGENINEPELAEALGVSRTPLREALLSLERDGILEARPGRGWWVAPLTPELVHELYPIIGALEALAVRSTPKQQLTELLEKLDRINVSRAQARDAGHAREIDDEWHNLLLSRCPNARLLHEIDILKRNVVYRYEHPYITSGRDVDESIAQHGAVTKALREGKVAAASKALEQSWLHNAGLVARWIEHGGASEESQEPARGRRARG